MARKDTFSRPRKLNIPETSILDDILGEEINEEELDVTPLPSSIEETRKEPVKEDAPKEVEPEPKSEPKPKKKKENKTKQPIKFSANKDNAVSRSFRIDPDVSEAIDRIVTRNGKKISGSRGFIKTLVSNALIKELVELQALDESYLDEIVPYEE